MPGNYRYEEERNRGQRGSQRGGFGGRGRDDDEIEQYEGERFGGGGSHDREWGIGRGGERYQGGSEGSNRGQSGRDYGRSLGGRANEGYDEDDFSGSWSGGERETSRYGGSSGYGAGQGDRGQQRWGSQRGSQGSYGGGLRGQGGMGYGGQSSGRGQEFGGGRVYEGGQDFGGARGGSLQGDGGTGEPDEMRWGRQQGLYGSSEYGGYISSQRSQHDSHAGKGPKGWRRSDERVREEVNEALARHPEIDASEIEVRVQNGEVTLTGSVTDRRAKRIAEDIAEGVFGASDVQNQLKVERSKGGDREVTGTAERESRTEGRAGNRGTRGDGRARRPGIAQGRNDSEPVRSDEPRTPSDT